jgi:thiosulfate/3-mercaptopyruvate sulfurtransferase
MGDAAFMQSTHGKAGCVICHGGDSMAAKKELAHDGLVADPSETSCLSCHQDVTHADEKSLHSTLTGMKAPLVQRGGLIEKGSPLETAFNNHCASCHTTCGQCHVSRPDEAGGGLVSSHKFLSTPSMQYNCVACHGSRVGDEYLGNNPGVPGDVHWTKEGMTCTKCHGEELHGSGETVNTRYQNPDATKCEDCHKDVWTNTAVNPQHRQHLSDLSCQVCHSVNYKNCYNCHVDLDNKGLPYRTSDPTEMLFKIGLNPLRSSANPYKYVVLRHAPASPDTFSHYGNNLLPDFNNLPTWKYATPHNIQRKTPQNAGCDTCHTNTKLFLTEGDVRPEERAANKGVVVTEFPPKVGR